jgi:hypothetical protein
MYECMTAWTYIYIYIYLHTHIRIHTHTHRFPIEEKIGYIPAAQEYILCKTCVPAKAHAAPKSSTSPTRGSSQRSSNSPVTSRAPPPAFQGANSPRAAASGSAQRPTNSTKWSNQGSWSPGASSSSSSSSLSSHSSSPSEKGIHTPSTARKLQGGSKPQNSESESVDVDVCLPKYQHSTAKRTPQKQAGVSSRQTDTKMGDLIDLTDES